MNIANHFNGQILSRFATNGYTLNDGEIPKWAEKKAKEWAKDLFKGELHGKQG